MAVTITRTAWTDDDGSGTTGTVINNAVKTELYGQIDTALALLLPLAGNAMTGSITGTVTWNAGAVTSSGPIIAATGFYTPGTVNGMNSAGTDLQFRTNGIDGVMRLSAAGVLTLNNLATGSLTSASGVITSSSDERMKDVLGPLDYGLKEVLALKPIRYHWNAQSGIPVEPEYGGFGAAQVETVMPLAVAYGNDGMRGLSDRVILGALVNAIKEFDERLNWLEKAA